MDRMPSGMIGNTENIGQSRRKPEVQNSFVAADFFPDAWRAVFL
jgi:hypothetical protein